MNLNTRLPASEKEKSPSLSLLISSLSQDMKVSELSEQEFQPNRAFAWQIAPSLLISFKYAWAGLRYAFVTQRNFRIHTAVGVLAISLGIFLEVTAAEMAVVGLTIALVLALELLNTAIESVVDLTVKQSYHILAKIAKDCAAGAVLVASLTAVLVAGLVLLPPLVTQVF